MDIRHYVKIKKIPGGSRSECRIVSGVVCTKNVVHKKMATAITQPQILMLACPVEFQVSLELGRGAEIKTTNGPDKISKEVQPYK